MSTCTAPAERRMGGIANAAIRWKKWDALSVSRLHAYSSISPSAWSCLYMETILLDWFVNKLKEKYELTESARPGPSSKDDKEVRVLNRTVRWTSEGVEYEADPRPVEQIVRDLDLTGSKAVTTPASFSRRASVLSRR